MKTPMTQAASPVASPLPTLQGTRNFRSLRGMRGQGGLLASHALLRSDHLQYLTATDWNVLKAIGLQTICDLRGPDERLKVPTRVPAELPLLLVHFDIRNDVRNNPELVRSVASNPDAPAMRTLMLRIYRSFPAVFAPWLPQWFGLFLERQTPVLVHCAAGKDRTGFLVAMLLHALGANRDDIMAGYLLSANPSGDSDHRIPGLQALFRELLGVDVDVAAILPILAAEPAYLQAAWEEISKSHGSIDQYLRESAGMDTNRLWQLRHLYLA